MNNASTMCKNCSQQFTIDPQEIKFYERIASPLPEYCPACRMQRRLAYRNERTLYPRACDLCKSQSVAIYPSGTPWPVYCAKCWYSDAWDAKQYGIPYDPSKPFFEQF